MHTRSTDRQLLLHCRLGIPKQLNNGNFHIREELEEAQQLPLKQVLPYPQSTFHYCKHQSHLSTNQNQCPAAHYLSVVSKTADDETKKAFPYAKA